MILNFLLKLLPFAHFIQTPTFFPSGWAGDVGDGPTTAYDALEPKKWKPADKK